MALTRVRKEELVQNLHHSLEQATSVIAADACGMSVAETDQLRVGIRALGAKAQVVPNRLALRAVKDTRFACLSEILQGPTLLAWSLQDPVPLASLMDGFESESLQMKGMTFGELLLSAAQIAEVARLPSREQALTQLAGVLQAPVAGLVRALGAVPRNIAYALAAVRDQQNETTLTNGEKQ